MKSFVFPLIILNGALVLNADPITNYFLAGEFLHYDSGKGFDPNAYPAPKVSFIVPVVDPDHLRAVREEAALTRNVVPVYNREQLVFTIDVEPTPDGLNRNYYLPGFPEWGWHATRLNGYAYGGGMVGGFYPYVSDLECTARGTCPGGWPGLFDSPWYSLGYYTFVKELGPHPLFVRFRFEEDTIRRIRLDWNVPPGGSNWSYTVEQQVGVTDAGWIPIPGITWPTTNTFFSVPLTNSNPILRVVARDGTQ